MSPGQLNSLLQTNVLDIKFNRRRLRPGIAPTRRMLCTMDNTILNSTNGRTVLNYIPPGNSGFPYNVSGKGLSMVWDILMQDFRMVSAESVNIITTYPGDDTFWEVFNETFVTMSQGDKIAYMAS